MAIAQLLDEQGYTEEIPFELLSPSPLNTFDTTDIDDLVANIKCCGLITPLSVAGPADDGTYEILSGERRFKAISEIRKEEDCFKTVPCCVIGPADMDMTVKKIIVESANLEARNEYDKDAHRFTLIGLYHELADRGSLGQQEIVRQIEKTLKVSPRYARMYNSIYVNATPELLKAAQTPSTYGTGEDVKPDSDVTHIPIAMAARAANLAEEDQRDFVRRVHEGERPSDVLGEYVSKDKDFGTPGTDGFAPSLGHADATYPSAGNFHAEDFSGQPGRIRPAGGTANAGTADDGWDKWDDDGWDEPGWMEDGEVPSDITDDFEDLIKGMRTIHKPVDLSISTVTTKGELNLMQNEKGTAPSRDTEWSIVSRWLNRMLEMRDFSNLQDEEADLMQTVCVLALHYKDMLAKSGVAE